MPNGFLTILRSTVLGSLGLAAIFYAGVVIVACIRLGSISELFPIAKFAAPWFLRSFFVSFVGLSIYAGGVLLVAKRNLRGSGVDLVAFMSLSLEKRHALIKSLRRGPYRNA